jgi:predicted TIM-barrel fold metal-dependent hydrolase
MQFIRQCFGMSKKVPQRIVDPHHHFYTPSVEAGPGGHSGFLRKLGAPDYPPEEYVRDKDQLNIVKSVHVEALPDDGVQEAAWVASLIEAGRAPTVKAIVGKVDLAAPDAAQKLEALVKTSDLVKGVRYIIDYDGPFGEDNGTHPEVSRHGKDYLRGPEASDFERGFSLLKKHGLSYDLQCAPAQLPAAAALLARPPVF